MTRIPIPAVLNQRFLIKKKENNIQNNRILKIRNATCMVNLLIKMVGL